MTAFKMFEDDTPDRGWETVRVVRNVHTGELAIVASSIYPEKEVGEPVDARAVTTANTPLRTETPAPARRGRPPGRRT